MAKVIDLTGMKFGRLTVVERAGSKNNYACWKCLCDCGKECIVVGAYLRNGDTKSCGCLHDEGNHKTHGMKGTPIYKKWKSIKSRCFNPNCAAYHNYGGRNITMFEDWIDNFQAFYDYVSTLEHFNEPNYSLDRINNDGNYEPGNLRFADRKTQCRNRRSNVIVEYQGKQMTLAEAAEKSGISYDVLKRRLQRGDTCDKLFRPVSR